MGKQLIRKYGYSMDSILMRLRCLTTPRGLLIVFASAALGFITITLLGKFALAEFSNVDPQTEAILSPFRDLFERRIESQAVGWIFSTIGFFWWLAGKELRKLDRLYFR